VSSDQESPIDDQIAALRAEVARLHAETARLREEVDDLRASAIRWSELYEAAIKLLNERKQK
jgi:cell division protein FtsB